MKTTRATRGIFAGALAMGALIGIGGVATAAEDVPEIHVKTAAYPLEYQLLNHNGDGYSATVQPNAERDIQVPAGYTTVDFFANGEHAGSWAPLEQGKTMHCTAGGTAEAPSVTC